MFMLGLNETIDHLLMAIIIRDVAVNLVTIFVGRAQWHGNK